MSKPVLLYRYLFLLIFALYIFLGKGIAYGFFAEILLALGLILCIKERRNITIISNQSFKILYLLLAINILYIIRGIIQYNFTDTIRDGFIFNYILFAFVILLFTDSISTFLKSILFIYKYYPITIFIIYLFSLNNFLGSISIFGNIHLFYFKFGDISVHLLAAFLFQISGLNNYKKPYDLLNLILIFFIFSIASSYSRGGMLSFLLGFFIFYQFLKEAPIKKQLKNYIKYLPITIISSFIFLSTFNISEDIQGRTVGVEQVATNFTSIFSNTEDGSLTDNKLWRILWWGQIIDYTFNGPYFIAGKGLGINLSEDDQILTTNLEGELRSPHNFNLTILARYGVFIFFVWVYWLFTQIKRLKNKCLSKLELILISLQIAFLFNASFDVFLEGPMGAFPFWVFVGIDLIYSFFNLYNSSAENDLFINMFES